jgi:hypothetical protein
VIVRFYKWISKAGKAPVEKREWLEKFPEGRSKDGIEGCCQRSPVYASALQAFLEFQPFLTNYNLLQATTWVHCVIVNARWSSPSSHV